MKKIISTVFVVTVMFLSCGDKFLVSDPKTVLPTDVALETQAGLESAIYSLYDFPRMHLRNMVYCYYFIAGTPLLKAKGLLTADWGITLYNSQLNPTHKATTSFWDTSYIALNQANAIIERAPTIAFDDDVKRNRLLAEARFFRAYILFYLEQRFENIPLITSEVKAPMNTYRPASKEAIYQVILEDLAFATATLDSTYDQTGRITKGTAFHLLAKVYMVLQRWSDAAVAALNVINSGKYELLADRSQLWADNSQNNLEGVYVIQFSTDPLDGEGHQLAQQFNPLIDRINGVKRSWENGGRPWARYYPSEYLLGLFEQTDERLGADYKTVWIYDDESAFEKTIKVLPTNATDSIEIHLGDTVKAEYVNNEMYYGPACKKYWEYGGHGRSLSEVASKKSVYRFRLAETYLIAGEALWRNGDAANGLAMINVVRTRAKATPYTDADMTEDKIIEEYFRELAFEQEDWFLLKRLGRLVTMNKTFSPDKDETEIDENNVRMPIPQSFIDATPGYPQNPGY